MIGENSLELEKIIEEYNSQYIFDEETEATLNKLLSFSNYEDNETFQNLRKEEAITHAPEIQYKLADLLMKMAMDLHQIEHPRSPICQWFMEMYYAPALYWAIKAVKQHYFPAYNLERIIVKQGAKDVDANFKLARALLFRAAEEGEASAQLDLAIAYGMKNREGFNAPPSYVDYDPEKSKRLYAEVEEKQDPMTFKYFARHYYYKGNYEKSIFYYKKLIELDDKNRTLRVSIVNNYIKMKNISAAAMEILDIISNENDSILLATFRGLHYDGWNKLNDIELERLLLEKLISNGNRTAMLWYEKGYKRTLFSKKLKRRKQWIEIIR